MGEDSRYGKIVYTIKASILLPRGDTTNSMEDQFYVSAVPDPSVPKPAEEDLPKAGLAIKAIKSHNNPSYSQDDMCCILSGELHLRQDPWYLFHGQD